MIHDNGDILVGGFTPLTTIDFPGELAAIVFCQGCPWRCRYCHNSELLTRRGNPTTDWNDVIAFLKRRIGLLDAVVFSGGEPTAQNALEPAIRAVRSLGYKVGIHTAGPYPDRLERIIGQVDWVGMDIKGMPSMYPSITGVPNSGLRAWKSAEIVIASGVEHEFRLTVHPTFLDTHDTEIVVNRLELMGAKNIIIQQCGLDNTLDPGLQSLVAVDMRDYMSIIDNDPLVSLR